MGRIPVDKEFNGSQRTIALPPSPRRSHLSRARISGVSILLADLSLSVLDVSPLSNKSNSTSLSLGECEAMHRRDYTRSKRV